MLEICDVVIQPQQVAWLEQLATYAARWPGESASVDLFRQFMQQQPDAAHRELSHAHLTGSAWLVSADGLRVLLTHHRKLGLWLQPGGHADGDPDLAQVALREAQEESGLPDLVLRDELFDIDRHWIPERGSIAGHWHYDLRYVVACVGDETFAVGPESIALAWRAIATLPEDRGMDASLRRMARKWLDESIACQNRTARS